MPRESSALPKLIVIVGPTASGKTELALHLAKKFNGEIISADSRQIYKGMDIGTAKLKKKGERGKKKVDIKNHLTDIVLPTQTFTAARFKKMAVKIIRDIWRRRKTPIMVGGTGFYIQAVADNLQIPRVPPDKALRKKLERKTTIEIIKILSKLDRAAARRHAPNRRYLIRAIEIISKTGGKLAATQKKGPPLFEMLQIGLAMPKEKLAARIDARVERMIRRGLPAEVRRLARRYSWRAPGLNAIGYKEISAYLRGEVSLKSAKELLKKNTRRYAKRQMTWFKRDKRIHWVNGQAEAEELAKEFLQEVQS